MALPGMLRALAVLVVLLGAAGSATAEWDQYQGTPGNTGFAAVRTDPAVAPSAIVELNRGPSGGPRTVESVVGPAVVGPDGTAYAGTTAGWLYAVTPAGAIRWAAEADVADRGDRILGAPLIGPDGSVYVASAARSIVIDNRTGAGGLRTVTQTTKLHAFTAAGQRRWSVPVPSLGAVGPYSSASPKLWRGDGETLVVLPAAHPTVGTIAPASWLYGFSAATGELRRSAEIAPVTVQTVTGNGCTATNPIWLCVALVTPVVGTFLAIPGAILTFNPAVDPCSIPLPGRARLLPTPALVTPANADRPLIIASDGTGTLATIAGGNGIFARAFQRPPGLPHSSPVALDRTSVILGEGDTSAVSVALPNLTPLPFPAGICGQVVAPPAVMLGITYVASDKGLVERYFAGTRSASIDLANEVRGGISLSSTHLFVSTSQEFVTLDHALRVVNRVPLPAGEWGAPAIAGDGRVIVSANGRMHIFNGPPMVLPRNIPGRDPFPQPGAPAVPPPSPGTPAPSGGGSATGTPVPVVSGARGDALAGGSTSGPSRALLGVARRIRGALVIRWTPRPGVARYDVRVFRGKKRVFRRIVRGSQLRLAKGPKGAIRVVILPVPAARRA